MARVGRGEHPVTPDGRYFVVSGRLWRMSNPSLAEERRQDLVHDLMAARRAIKDVKAAVDEVALTTARANVNRATVALGERGPPWWDDGSPDLNRHLVANKPYAGWYASRIEHS